MHEFARSWKIAGDEMERLRSDRLEKMAPEAGARLMGAVDSSSQESMYSNGLARWQVWMMRWRMKNLMEKLPINEDVSAATNLSKSTKDA